MSSQAAYPPSLQVVPTRAEADVNFVRKLLQKTEEKKLSWEKRGQTYTTTIPGSNVTVSLTMTSQAIFGWKWSNFAALKGSEEILRIEGNSNPFAMLTGLGVQPLASAIEELAAYLEGARTREVDQATSALERL